MVSAIILTQIQKLKSSKKVSFKMVNVALNKLSFMSPVTSVSTEKYGTKRSSTKADCKRPFNQQNKAQIESTYSPCITTADQDTFSYEHNYKTPILDYPQKDKKKVSSVLKRALLPHKTYYELEWSVPNYDNATTTKVWLQLDEQTSQGIDRVRRLGFNDLDVRLDDKITEYMINSVDSKESITLEILFSSGNYHNYRKDSVLQPSVSDQRKVHLVRLRRVHWWVKDYNLARAYLP